MRYQCGVYFVPRTRGRVSVQTATVWTSKASSFENVANYCPNARPRAGLSAGGGGQCEQPALACRALPGFESDAESPRRRRP